MMRFGIAAGALVLALTPVGIAAARPPQAPAQPASTPQAQAQAAPQPAAVPDGDPAIGRKLFVSVGCYQCHGYEGQGSSATGPRLGPRPMPFAGFSRYVRQPTGNMPLYGSRILSDTDLAHIYAFLRALPEPPPVKSIPLLN